MTLEARAATTVAIFATVALVCFSIALNERHTWPLAEAVGLLSLATATAWARAARLRGWFGGR